MSNSYPVDGRGFTDTNGASDYDGMSPSWHHKARHYGIGPDYVKAGKSVRYSYAALDAWMAERARTSTKSPEAA